MIKINFKLKNAIEAFINNLKEKEVYCISHLSTKDANIIFNKIANSLEEENYFVYKQGTKYTSTLMVVPNIQIINYFDNDYVIYDINTLDKLLVGETAKWEGGKMIEVYTTGKFNNILNMLRNNFTFNQEESKFP